MCFCLFVRYTKLDRHGLCLMCIGSAAQSHRKTRCGRSCSLQRTWCADLYFCFRGFVDWRLEETTNANNAKNAQLRNCLLRCRRFIMEQIFRRALQMRGWFYVCDVRGIFHAIDIQCTHLLYDTICIFRLRWDRDTNDWFDKQPVDAITCIPGSISHVQCIFLHVSWLL